MPVMTETRCRVGSVQARLSIQGVKGSLIHTPFFSAQGCNHRVYPEGCHARKNKNRRGLLLWFRRSVVPKSGFQCYLSLEYTSGYSLVNDLQTESNANKL